MGAGNLNSAPHASTAHTLPTEPCPSPVAVPSNALETHSSLFLGVMMTDINVRVHVLDHTLQERTRADADLGLLFMSAHGGIPGTVTTHRNFHSHCGSLGFASD